MSQADAVRFLHENGLPADIIHDHLVEVFGPLAMAYSTVTRTVREMSWRAPETDEVISRARRPNHRLETLVQDLLGRKPGASVREIATELHLSPSTVFYVLTNQLGYGSRKCRIVPHALSPRQHQD
jgi:hypothetical protein